MALDLQGKYRDREFMSRSDHHLQLSCFSQFNSSAAFVIAKLSLVSLSTLEEIPYYYLIIATEGKRRLVSVVLLNWRKSIKDTCCYTKRTVDCDINISYKHF